MLIFFLTAIAVSRQYVVSVKPTQRVLSLHSFGFLKGGAFDFQFTSANLTGAALLLVSEEQASSIVKEYYRTNLICRFKSSFLAYRAFFPSQSNQTWNGTMSISDVIVPVAVNCNNMSFSIASNFRNPTTFLDSRERCLPFLYPVLSFVYSGISIALIFNSVCFLRFSVDVHTALSFSFLLKSASLFLLAKYWIFRSSYDSFPRFLYILCDFFQFSSNSILLIVNAAAVFGWGIYRDKIQRKEWISIATCASCLNACRVALAYTPFWLIEASLTLIMACSFVLYMDYISAGILVCYSLIDEFGDDDGDSSLREKLQMNVNLGNKIILLMLIVVLYVIAIEFVSTTSNSEIAIEEAAFFLLGLIDMQTFVYRNKFTPKDYVEAGKVVEGESELFMLNEPKSDEYSFLRTTISTDDRPL